MSEPKTAIEALASWRESRKWIEDSESGERPKDLYAAADLCVRLAENDEISLEELVPDEDERRELQGDKEDYYSDLQAEMHAYD